MTSVFQPDTPPQIRVAGVYALTATLWILFSDIILIALGLSSGVMSIIKGILFVAVTTGVLYVYLRSVFNQRLLLEKTLRQQIAEVERSQAAVKASEARFRRAIEDAPMPIMMFNEAGDILHLSNTWLEITGYTRSEIPDLHTWVKRAYGDRADQVQSVINRLFERDRRVDEGEFVVRCADGSERIWAFSSTPLPTPAGSQRTVISMASDVTDYRHVQHAAQQNSRILGRMFDITHISLAYMDADFNFIKVNESYAAADGKSPEDFIGKNHFELYPHPENERIFRRVVETGEPYTTFAKPFTYPEQPKTGITYWDWSLYPVLDKDQHVSHVLLTLVDVTERVRAEEQVRIKDSAIAASITPFALANMDGTLTYVNDAFAHFWRLNSPDEALGRSVLSFWKSSEAAQQVVASLTEHDNYVGELTARLADGTEADVALTSTLVRDETGNPLCMMGSFNDITQRKQAEQYALDNARLQARFQKEQERNALVQQIISALSHDLRTPLTVISTAREMLTTYFDRLTPAKRREKLNTIGRQVNFALELLDDTVNMARGSITEAPFRPAPVNVAALCQVSVDEIRVADTVGHRLVFVNKTDITTAKIDEVLVSRILLNLLSNAMKYSPDHSTIYLELDHEAKWLILRVKDAGIGIDASELPHIFEPFYRSNNVGSVKGSGLGLSIVRDCVERHQGQIEVQSTVNSGTTFTVKLPFVQVEQPLQQGVLA